MGDERRHPVVAEAAGVDARRNEVVAERVHGDERRELARVSEVVGKRSTGERRARGRLAREDLDVTPADLLAEEREGEPREVRAAPDAAGDKVREDAAISICASASCPITVWCMSTWLSTLPSE